MQEYRCGACRRLLAKGLAERLQAKCPRCGTLNNFEGLEPRTRTPESVVHTKGKHCDRQKEDTRAKRV
ncbi:Com family DNA-binding transcriptional regulator [Thiohalomonas denitrificans]|uniref:Com family DNA-binding transcriptional regulator n=1 Tax=Thiohalomonas denitrificans TaxID=415747 RepID=UPI00294FF441|nr:Com family DNA-binding transcriptional regulator [Thiohalomonas denitrificans]